MTEKRITTEKREITSVDDFSAVITNVSETIRSIEDKIKILPDDVILEAVNQEAENTGDYIENNMSEEELEMAMVVYRGLLNKQLDVVRDALVSILKVYGDLLEAIPVLFDPKK